MGKGSLDEIPRFKESHLMTKQYCQEMGYDYWLWGEEELLGFFKEFRNGQYLDFYINFKFPVMKVDFARYAILYAYGGIYLDLDVNIIPGKDITHLTKLDPLIVRWNGDPSMKPYIAVLGCRAESQLFLDVLNHSVESYQEKIKMPIYEVWSGRLVFQTTGHFMLQRVLRRHKFPDSDKQNILHVKSKGKEHIAPDPIFLDTNESIWYDGRHRTDNKFN